MGIPLAVAEAALEELLKAWRKQANTFHVVFISQLMTLRWRRLFNKASNFTFMVSPGMSFWMSNMFEPLWLGILLPFSKHRPWCLKRAPLLLEMGKNLREVHATGKRNERDDLQKLQKLPGLEAPKTECMACGVLHIPWTAPCVSNNGSQGQARKSLAQVRRRKAKEVWTGSSWGTLMHTFSVGTVLGEKSGREKLKHGQGQVCLGLHTVGQP